MFIWEKLISFPDSFVLTGLIEAAALQYSGLKIEELSLDEKAEILFVDQRCGIFFSFNFFLLYACWFYPFIYSLPKYHSLFTHKSNVLHFLYCSIATTVVLAVLYSLTKSFSPLPDDIYRYGN